MRIIKLNATDSTNAYLKNLRQLETLQDLTTVVAHEQSEGRGQVGASWESEAGKNLTLSVLKKFESLPIADRFLVNICVSLAIVASLKEFSVPDLHIKWPNDILSGHAKICGILIENILSGEQIKSAIVGIGLNVNQTIFNTVSNASSMKLLLGKSFNLDELLRTLLTNLKGYFNHLDDADHTFLWEAYTDVLFQKDEPSTFEGVEKNQFTGIIKGVSGDGKLIVELEDALLTEFDLKEVRLLY